MGANVFLTFADQEGTIKIPDGCPANKRQSARLRAPQDRGRLRPASPRLGVHWFRRGSSGTRKASRGPCTAQQRGK